MILRDRFAISIAVLAVLLLEIVSAKNAGNDECSCESGNLPLDSKGVKAASAGLLAAYGTTASLGSSVVGFTTAGIAKGSLAALIQAKIGTVAGFSLLQSFGASGALTMFGPVGVGVLGVVSAATYLLSSSGDAEASKDCTCDDTLTEEDLTQYFELKKIESCVEPGTSKSTVCSGRGSCDFNKDDEELYCICTSNNFGTYCEIFKNDTSKPDIEMLPNITSITGWRCNDEFVQNCTRCLINKFTLGNPKNCYHQCNWNNRKSPVLKDDNIKPDVGSLEMKRVVKMSVMDGSECLVQINSTCSTIIKYNYEHTDDHLDQLVVYYSSDEATCEIDTLFSSMITILTIYIGGLLAWLMWKSAVKMYSTTSGIEHEKN